MPIKPIEHFIFAGIVKDKSGVKVVQRDDVIYGLDADYSGININDLKVDEEVFFMPVPREFFYGVDRKRAEFICLNVTKRRMVLQEKSSKDENRPCQHIAVIDPIEEKEDDGSIHYFHYSLNDYAELCLVRTKSRLKPWKEVIAFEGNVKYTVAPNSSSLIPIYEYRREADYEWV